jgi:biotin carboxyl carrier protein
MPRRNSTGFRHFAGTKLRIFMSLFFPSFIPILFRLALLLAVACVRPTLSAAPKPEMVILDAIGVKNLRLETAPVEEKTFERTVFALGQIEVFPGHRAVLSSRIPGRAVEVAIKHDHPIEKGEKALTVESRIPGNPPPVIPVFAPISGLVNWVKVAPGEPVDPDKALAEIIDLSRVYALARIPEHLAGSVRPGSPATITVSAVPGQTFTAKLEHFGATVDAESGTLEGAFELENPASLLRPGMRAEFSIAVDRRENVFAVPRAALQGDAAQRFVFVKDFDLPNAFIKTPVEVGEMNEQLVEILSGLLPGDEVVTRGAYSLSFVGGSGISLKEALDAAHGHEHNADGSEIIHAPKQKEEHHSHESPLWKIVSGVLFAALLAVMFTRKRGHAE